MGAYRIILKLLVDVIDPQRLRSYATQRAAIFHRDADVLESLGDCAAEALLTSAPGPTPESVGMEILSIEPRQLETTSPSRRCLFHPVETWLIEVLVAIHNPLALRAYAVHRYAACWHKRLTFINNDEQAVYESLIGSSEGPPPNHLGVRLSQWSYRQYPP
jgi:hypothetical protein